MSKENIAKYFCSSEISNAQDNKFRTVLFALLGCPRLGCLIKVGCQGCPRLGCLIMSAQHSQHQTNCANTLTTTTTTTTIGKNSSFSCFYDIVKSITGLKMYAHKLPKSF